jgi:serine/threonine protein kinase
LKTSRRSGAIANYEHEMKAFQRMTEAGLKAPRGIVECFGSFEHRGHFNIILEYAELGTLKESMRKDSRPSGVEAITNLWTGVFEIIHGLSWIHKHHSSPLLDAHVVVDYG